MQKPHDIQVILKAAPMLRTVKRLPRPPDFFLPKLVIMQYRKKIIELVDRWRKATERILVPHLPGIEKLVKLERPAVNRDAWPDDLSQQIDLLRKEYDRLSEQSSALAYGTFNEINGMSRTKWYALAKAVMGVDLIKGEPWIETEARAFVRQNLSLIKKVSEGTLSDIEQILMTGFRQGKRIETMGKEITSTDLPPTAYKAGEKRVFLSAEARAELIARDQTAKLWGDLNRLRQTNVGVDMYIWRTVRDERVVGNPTGKYPNPTPVHKNHWKMDGLYCRWDDATVYAESLQDAMAGKWKKRTADMPKAHPGEEINCRCFGSPVFQSLFTEVREAA